MLYDSSPIVHVLCPCIGVGVAGLTRSPLSKAKKPAATKLSAPSLVIQPKVCVFLVPTLVLPPPLCTHTLDTFHLLILRQRTACCSVHALY